MSIAQTTAETDGQTVLAVEGMHCAACVRRVERALVGVDGVAGASADFLSGRAILEIEGEAPQKAALAAAIERAGYRLRTAADDDAAQPPDRSPPWRAALALSLGWAMFAAMQANRWGELGWDRDLLFLTLFAVATPALALTGWPIAAQGLRLRGGANMDTLIALGAFAAWGYSAAATFAGGAFESAGAAREVFFDTALIIVGFVTLGRWLEERVKRRAASAVAGLLALQPQRARVLRDGVETETAVDEIAVGDLLVVRPGERIAVDGVVVGDISSVDEASLTGESAPVGKEAGGQVFAGTINLDGSLRYEAREVGAGTTLARMAAAVERAQASKAPIQRLADRIAAVFVPAVIAVAALSFALWAAFGPQPAWTLGLLSGVAVLVVACPCALGLATPAAIAAGAGRAAALGVLFRDAEALERAARVDTVVFDKTGTLTTGRHQVVELRADGIAERELLALAAAVESSSEHPLAAAVVEHAQNEGIAIGAADDFRALPGRGALGRVGERDVAVGNLRMLRELGIELTSQPMGEPQGPKAATALVVAVDGEPVGAIWTADEVKATSREAVASLQAMGMRVLIVSGDAERVARAVGEQVGVSEVVAEALPEEKAGIVAALQAEGAVVAMVGDGVNDAPALAQADLGAALRGGADLAVDAGGATVMRGDPSAVAQALALARATRRTIAQNLGFAFAYNLLLIPLAAGIGWPIFAAVGGVPGGLEWAFGERGAFEPIVAAIAMMLSSLSVLTNALRLQRRRIG